MINVCIITTRTCIAGGIPACLAGGLQGVSRPTLRGCLLQGGTCFRGGAACSRRGACSEEVPAPEGVCVKNPPVTNTAAGATHPTTMHSCFIFQAIYWFQQILFLAKRSYSVHY